MKANGITCLDYYGGGDGSLTLILGCTAEEALTMDTLTVDVTTDDGDLAARFVNLVKVSATVDAQTKQVSLLCAAATGDMAKAVSDIVVKVADVEQAAADAKATADSAKQAAEQAGADMQVAAFARIAVASTASSLTDEQAMEVSTLLPEWAVGVDYKARDLVTRDGRIYRCAQAHTSSAEHDTSVASLWTAISVAGDGLDVWQQPTGAHDAYPAGTRVHYPTADGPVYESLIDGNCWSPDAYPRGWKLVDDADAENPDQGGGTDPEQPDTDGKTEPTAYPEFVQPTGAHDAYSKGDRVTYGGKVYESLIDGNAYSPDAYPAGWQLIEEV